MANDNPDWGAPKIHGELQKVGFVVSERSVARYLRRIRQRGDPGKRWLAFLQNHREAIVAFDFFTVPTVTFQLLYCFFVIEHAGEPTSRAKAEDKRDSDFASTAGRVAPSLRVARSGISALGG